jgi:hypothetical protein
VSWVDPILDNLARSAGIGYLPGSKAAAEPTALAALAFLSHGRIDSALPACDELSTMQQANGEVGVRAGEDSPGWPTSLAIVAWSLVERHTSRSAQTHIQPGLKWLLANRGRRIERSEAFGHNTELVGWAYAEGTHSWVEPTAFAVLALKAAGHGHTVAAREGVAVLIDRQLPGGGLNYGNTFVLGQLLRSHIQPTGIGLLALSGEHDPSDRITKSIAWLRRSIGPETTAQSLAWAILGMAAQGELIAQRDDWLRAAAERVLHRDQSPYKLALLVLAAKGWPQ